MTDTTPSRHEKSLGLLTSRFVTLLQEAKDGVLDLKMVTVILMIYDNLSSSTFLHIIDNIVHSYCSRL